MCLFVIVCWHRGEAIQSNGYHHPNSYIGELLTAADRCKKSLLYFVAKCRLLGANPNLVNSSKGAGLEKKRLQLIFNLTNIHT